MLKPGVKIGYVLVAQSCPTHWDPMICSLPGSSVHGILQAIGNWIAIPFSRSARPRDQTWVSCIAGRFFTLGIGIKKTWALYDFLPYHPQGLFSPRTQVQMCVWVHRWLWASRADGCVLGGRWRWLCVLSPHGRGGNQDLDERKPRSGCCWRGPEFLVRPGREAEPLVLGNWKCLRVIRVQVKLLNKDTTDQPNLQVVGPDHAWEIVARLCPQAMSPLGRAARVEDTAIPPLCERSQEAVLGWPARRASFLDGTVSISVSAQPPSFPCCDGSRRARFLKIGCVAQVPSSWALCLTSSSIWAPPRDWHTTAFISAHPKLGLPFHHPAPTSWPTLP